MKYALLALGAILVIGAMPATAEAGHKHCGGGGSNWSVSVGFGYASSGWGYGGYGGYGYGGYGGYGGYCAPAPVYYAPAPVYVAPPVAYCPPSYYTPRCGPSYGGYYNGRVSYRYRD